MVVSMIFLLMAGWIAPIDTVFVKIMPNGDHVAILRGGNRLTLVNILSRGYKPIPRKYVNYSMSSGAEWKREIFLKTYQPFRLSTIDDFEQLSKEDKSQHILISILCANAACTESSTQMLIERPKSKIWELKPDFSIALMYCIQRQAVAFVLNREWKIGPEERWNITVSGPLEMFVVDE